MMSNKKLVRLSVMLLFTVINIGMPLTLAAQDTSIRYVYDENGRLRAVIPPAGEPVVYEYDAVGNLLSIRRLHTEALELISFAPRAGAAGDLVTFYGVGFGAGVNSVSFNGAAAQIIQVTPSSVIAAVPQNATTGTVIINAARGIVTTTQPFSVVPRVAVSPAVVRLVPNDMFQFSITTASLVGDQSMTWSVNGIVGGSSAVGMITSAGLYTAPAQPPASSPIINIRATSVAQPTYYGRAEVMLLNPSAAQQLVSPAVSVRRGHPVGTVIATLHAVSVRRGSANGASEVGAAPVSVRRGSASGSGSVESWSVSLTTGPHISAISPSLVGRGATHTLTLTGINLGDASALNFITSSGALDANITVSNISVNAEGTSLTATVVINASAALGRRVVLVTTPGGASLTVDIQTNAIEVSS